MSDGVLTNAVETFSAPIEHLIVALGQGIADAQRALDQSSIQTQDAIDSDPTLSQLGLQATWYQFPKVDLELKLAISVAQQGAPGGGPVRLVAQPISASYQTHFNYDATAASTLSLSIVPVPAPRAGDAASAPPHLDRATVVKTALASTATDAKGKTVKFSTVKDNSGNTVPDPALRFDVNYNGAARLWYILQYSVATPAPTPTVVAIDDATGTVRVLSTP